MLKILHPFPILQHSPIASDHFFLVCNEIFKPFYELYSHSYPHPFLPLSFPFPTSTFDIIKGENIHSLFCNHN